MPDLRVGVGGYGIWSMPTTSIVALMRVCWFIGECLSESGYSGFKDLQDRNPEISHRTDGAKGIDRIKIKIPRFPISSDLGYLNANYYLSEIGVFFCLFCVSFYNSVRSIIGKLYWVKIDKVSH